MERQRNEMEQDWEMRPEKAAETNSWRVSYAMIEAFNFIQKVMDTHRKVLIQGVNK